MLKIKKTFLVAVFCAINTIVFAQTVSMHPPGSENFMESNGKIFVVMAVVVTIVAGIFLYLINLDLKIKKLEKQN